MAFGTLFRIPIDETAALFKIRTVLDTVEVVLRFEWNGRENRWTLHILDAQENPLLMGLVLNINSELIERFEIPGLPPGLLVLYDTSDKNQECGRNDLGKRCVLMYESAS